MTTVGYGDKSPKSTLGRIFSVVWICIGIVAYGLLIGVVYSEVMKVNSPAAPKIKDAKVITFNCIGTTMLPWLLNMVES